MREPAGIGPEIVLKTVADEETLRIARCIVVGSRKVIEHAMNYPGSPRLELRVVEKPEDGIYEPGVLNMIDLDNEFPKADVAGGQTHQRSAAPQ